MDGTIFVLSEFQTEEFSSYHIGPLRQMSAEAASNAGSSLLHFRCAVRSFCRLG
jgi:hypothetical protein